MKKYKITFPNGHIIITYAYTILELVKRFDLACRDNIKSIIEEV